MLRRTDDEILLQHQASGIPAVLAESQLVDLARRGEGDGVITGDAREGDRIGLLQLQPVLLEGPVADAVSVVPLVEAEASRVDVLRRGLVVGELGERRRDQQRQDCGHQQHCVTKRERCGNATGARSKSAIEQKARRSRRNIVE